TIQLDARRIAEELFGDHMMTNIIALGAACQAGLLPLTPESIEAAIRLNGVQVEANTNAFRHGRLAVHDPGRIEALLAQRRTRRDGVREHALANLSASQRADYDRLMERCAQLANESRRLVATRAAELIDYQSVRLAQRYVDFVLRVAASEAAALGETGSITRAAARNHYKLLAYKDEYEVARLHL